MAPAVISQVVSGPEALAQFRQGLTGPRAVEQLEQAGGRLLVTLPVGVGKTQYLIDIIRHTRAVDGPYDLVVVLVPRRDLLQEILQKLPPGLPHLVLEPRPRTRCGALDAPWREHEATNCGLLAREQLCRTCPRRQGCPWPGQYTGERLAGVGLVLATQQHLVLDPGFVGRLRQLTGAKRVLVLLDESDLLVRAARRAVGREDLLRFIAAQEAVLVGDETPTRAMLRWLELSRLVAQAPTDDLRGGHWHFPRVGVEWGVGVQQAGRDLAGPKFRFPAFDLVSFARSDPMSRERTDAGDLQFACPPDLGDDFIVFSGTVTPELARYRLDPDHRRPGLSSPFEGHRFEHPGTRWFNVNSVAGAAKYFPRNSPAILDFFAGKIARNIRDGRRTLLVARKRFLGPCADYLTRRLKRLGAGTVHVVTGAWDEADLADPRTLPLISYGISGVNRFEGHDCAYCLTGYYVSAATVAAAVQDLEATPDRFPVWIRNRGNPARRVAHVDLPDDREALLPQLARWTLEQKEADVVVQAVGRVRPFTRPREVITFQVGVLPGVHYTLEFGSLDQARRHFGIPTRRQSEAEARAAAARRLKALGLTNRRIASRLGVSLSTVKRCLRPAGGHETS